jgi:hypothetical protein
MLTIKKTVINKMLLLLYISSGLIYFGCATPAALLSPTKREQKIPAQYQIKKYQDKNILILVEAARASRADKRIVEALGTDIALKLKKRAKVSEKNLVLAWTSPQTAVNQQGSPAKIAQKMDAGLAFYVVIEHFQLYQAGHSDYYSGQLITSAAIVDARTEKVIWPEKKQVKRARSVVELDTYGMASALDRLTQANAHILTRYLYDCPADQFKPSDEGSYLIEAMEFKEIR